MSSSFDRTFNIGDTPSGPTFKIAASSNTNDFMNSPLDPSTVPGSSNARSTPRVDKIVERVWNQSSPNKKTSKCKPIEVVYLDKSHSTDKNTTDIITWKKDPIVEVEPITTNQNETEEHEVGATNFISDIKPKDFYDPSEFWA